MRITVKLFLVLILGIAVSSCFDPPSFSNTPVISNPRVAFTSDGQGNENLIITVHFTDGDGDDGLSSDINNLQDNSGPFTNNYYYTRKGLKLEDGGIDLSSKYVFLYTGNGDEVVADTLLSYSDLRLGGVYDTLPEITTHCEKWEVLSTQDEPPFPTDTVYQTINPNNSNIFINLLIRDAQNEFQRFDVVNGLGEGICLPHGLNNRYPILFTDANKSGPLEGDITLSMPSSGWTSFFGRDVIKIEVYIKDRALNTSNVLTTASFTLASVTK